MLFILKSRSPPLTARNQPFGKLYCMREKSLPRAALPSTFRKLKYVFTLWPAVKLAPKPVGEPGDQYGTGATWACADCAPTQSAVNTNAISNLPAKVDMRATAKCETIRARYRKRQSKALFVFYSFSAGASDRGGKAASGNVCCGSRREQLEVSKSLPLYPRKRKSAPISNTSG